MKTSSQSPTQNAYKVYFLRDSRDLRVEKVVTVLATTPEEARTIFEQNVCAEVDPVITQVIPVYWASQARRYVTVPEA